MYLGLADGTQAESAIYVIRIPGIRKYHVSPLPACWSQSLQSVMPQVVSIS